MILVHDQRHKLKSTKRILKSLNTPENDASVICMQEHS